MISVLSGGVGAARLLRALRLVRDDASIEAIVNVGDDLVLHGLTICPDVDTIIYTLAGLNNEELGWGLRGETWRVMSELRALGGEDWFGLGDRDLATHLYRSQRLSQGATKTEVTAELCARHGVALRVLPASDAPLATVLDTELGTLSFQEYFVRHHHAPRVHAVRFVGDARHPSAAALRSLDESERIVLAPSNPLLSLAPILTFDAIADRLRARRDDVVAVSPIIGGAAVKGPADRLLADFGYEVSCVGVARYLRERVGDVVGTWVIDEVDAAEADELRALGVSVRVTTTLMSEESNARRLAETVLA